MRQITTRAVLAAGIIAILASCGDDDSTGVSLPGAPSTTSTTTTTENPGLGGDPVETELVEFYPDGLAQVRGGAISDSRIDPVTTFGFEIAGDEADTISIDDDRDGPDEGVVYVAVSGSSGGCNVPTSAELLREGDDLRVEFGGGESDDDVTCYRPIEAYAQFRVDAADVEGVATVGGQPLIDPHD